MEPGPANRNGRIEEPADRTTVVKGGRPANGGAQPVPGQKEKGLFSDLSVPQVAAGALAAVTSMLLSNQIGIAGSVIGVAVGSVVSTVASSLYKRALARGANRIKEKIVLPGEEAKAAAKTGLSPATGGRAQIVGDEAGTVAANGARIAPEGLRERARARREHTMHKRVTAGVIAVSVVAAIVGVWLSAGFVTIATGGQGLGEKVSVIRSSKPAEADSAASATSDQKTDDSAGTTDKGSAASKDTGSGASSSGSTDTGQNQGSTGTGSSSSTSTGAGSGGENNGQGTDNNQGASSGNQDTSGSDSGQGGQSQGGSSATSPSQDTGTGAGQGSTAGTGAAAQSQSASSSDTGAGSAS
ncbi:hypothetical protein AAK967_00470 [Atopobiaceae bacterium 24-176]